MATITITGLPNEVYEIVAQLQSANAGLWVDSVRREANRRTFKVIVIGKADATGVVSDEVETYEDAVRALRNSVQL